MRPSPPSAVDDTSVEHCPDQPHPCVLYEPGDPSAPTVALVGDSTAQMYRPALLALAEQYGFRFVQEAMGGCPIGDRLIATGIDGELHKPSNFMCYEAIPGVYEELVDLAGRSRHRHVVERVEPARHRRRARRSRHRSSHARNPGPALEQSVDVHHARTAPDVAFLTVLPPGPFMECLETSAPDEGACLRAIPTPSPIDAVNQTVPRARRRTRRRRRRRRSRSTSCAPVGQACPLSIDDVVVRYDGTHFTGTWSRNLAPVLDQRLHDLGVDLAQL